jgi:hypothetical protein
LANGYNELEARRGILPFSSYELKATHEENAEYQTLKIYGFHTPIKN